MCFHLADRRYFNRVDIDSCVCICYNRRSDPGMEGTAMIIIGFMICFVTGLIVGVFAGWKLYDAFGHEVECRCYD